ncbi:MAG: GntR family transcriptional regulator [Oscillospiraceae bacterium]|nr:GntR family transcriptional regulator [Oscillospiraceae bacterium]MBQ6610245.1 GntR family transcriptional regulator [Oscillospiraceae bacterium]MBQ9332602.1 GntR family transcriptional regulator [Oscillospiraceae bacterium]
MDWSFRSDQPIYSQLVQQIRLAIISGTYPPGQRLMSVRDMAAEAGVNPNTMQRALQDLEREGMVCSQRTTGRFVTEDPTVIEQARTKVAEEQIRVFFETMRKLGYPREAILALLKEEEGKHADT